MNRILTWFVLQVLQCQMFVSVFLKGIIVGMLLSGLLFWIFFPVIRP